MADKDFNLDDIAQLIRLVESQNLSELIVEEEGQRIVIRGKSYRAGHPTLMQPMSAAESVALNFGMASLEGETADAQSVDEAVAEEAAMQARRIQVSAPMVGVFYRSSGPDTAPYVEIGDRIEIGQVIGLLEAMKVFSEVQSDVAGTVKEILAGNAELVRTGDPLMYLV